MVPIIIPTCDIWWMLLTWYTGYLSLFSEYSTLEKSAASSNLSTSKVIGALQLLGDIFTQGLDCGGRETHDNRNCNMGLLLSVWISIHLPASWTRCILTDDKSTLPIQFRRIISVAVHAMIDREASMLWCAKTLDSIVFEIALQEMLSLDLVLVDKSYLDWQSPLVK